MAKATTNKFQFSGKLNFKWAGKKKSRGIQLTETRPENFVGIITNSGKITGRIYWSNLAVNSFPVLMIGKRFITAEKNPLAIPFLEAVKETCFALWAERESGTDTAAE